MLIGNSGADFYICGPANDIAISLTLSKEIEKLQIVKQ
jgi:hypothetical protein